MKIGLFTVGTGKMLGGALLKAVAINAERLGVATLWVPEHVVLIDKYASKYPYTQDGRLPAPTNAPIFDPFIALATMAAVTTKIRLATGICLVPEHNPVVLAKVIATLDFLSAGRTVLGVGIGWLEEEFEAIGVPWERRAHRVREYIEAMRALWAGDVVSYSGEFVNFHGVQSYPKPVNNKRVPVWFGGHADVTLKRTARWGDGWMMLSHQMGPEAETAFATLRRYVEDAGRDPSTIGLEVWVSTGAGGPADWRKEFEYWKSVGVTHVTVNSTFNRGPHRRIKGRTMADHLAAMKQYYEAVADLL